MLFPPCGIFEYVGIMFWSFHQISPMAAIIVIGDLKQEEAVKKTRRTTGKFLLKWNEGWLSPESQ